MFSEPGRSGATGAADGYRLSPDQSQRAGSAARLR